MKSFILALGLVLAVSTSAFAETKKKAPAKPAEPTVHCDIKKDPKCASVVKKPLTKEEREAKKKAKEAAAQK